jgi:hypothetical protein
MGEMEKGGQACKVNNGGERSPFRAQPKEEEGVFIPPPHEIWPLQNFRLDYPALGAKIRPKIHPPYRKPHPKVLSRNSRAGLFK